MKPVKTEYGGACFKSRLEARWAVFFDSLNVRWEYEPEQFKLPSGDVYTPDFLLPERRIYLEVKPGGVQFRWEWPKLADFSVECARMSEHERQPYWFYALQGRPHAYGCFPNYVFHYAAMLPRRYQGAVSMVPTSRVWAVCPLCHVADLSEVCLAGEASLAAGVNYDTLLCRWCAASRPAPTVTSKVQDGHVLCTTLGHVALDRALVKAYAAAREHRFE